jgi:hemerythrin-like domain-containing protein
MTERRSLLKSAAAAAAAAMAAPAFAQQRAMPMKTPGEDLMQEHGLVGRVILVYRRAIELAEANRFYHPDRVAAAAQIVSRVIHGHHEPEEEEIMFPVLEKPVELNMLVSVLRGQHRAARALTARIGLEIADPGRKSQALQAMRDFIQMYEPHGAYENSIVYPAFRETVGPRRYAELSKLWADNERKLLGSFGNYTTRLAGIEQALGLSLADYTPPPPPPRRSS